MRVKGPRWRNPRISLSDCACLCMNESPIDFKETPNGTGEKGGQREENNYERAKVVILQEDMAGSLLAALLIGSTLEDQMRGEVRQSL